MERIDAAALAPIIRCPSAITRARRHPYAVLCFLLFRVAAVVAYLLCLFISDNFVLNFVCVSRQREMNHG